METQQATKKGFTVDEKLFEKVDVEILKLDLGESFIGRLKSVTDRPWLDKKASPPVEKMIAQYNFEAPDGSNFAYFGDGGFKNALSTAGIVEGDIIKVIKGEKIGLGGAHTVNTYEVQRLRKQ